MLNQNTKKGLLYLSPIILLFLIFFVAPVFSMIRLSFLEWSPTKKAVFIFFENYFNVLGDVTFLQSFYNTIVYTIIVTPIIFLTALFFALLLKEETKFNIFFRVVFFLPFIISFVAAGYIWLWMLSDSYGILNYVLLKLHIIDMPLNFFNEQYKAITTVSVMIGWKTQGLSMLLILSGLMMIPKEVYEASAIDGAGKLGTFFRITLPMLRPTLTLALILSLAGSFKAFDQFYIMTQGNPLGRTTTVLMYINHIGFEYFEVGKSAAASVLFTVFLLLLSALQLKIGRHGDE